jgi:hypothetical protein
MATPGIHIAGLTGFENDALRSLYRDDVMFAPINAPLQGGTLIFS